MPDERPGTASQSIDPLVTLDIVATLGDFGERALIALIDSIVGKSAGVLGIGDDAAAISPPPGYDILATTDSLVQDVHFRMTPGGGKEVGKKALAVNLSDIAAMGGIPRWALISLVAPSSTRVAYIRDVYSGLDSMAGRYDVAIVGGNVSSSRGPLVIDVTLLGLAPAGQVIRRSGAEVGDIIAVTGTLGRAAAHRILVERGIEREESAPLPEPRVAVGRALAEAGIPHAMLDISDGLATDVHHLAASSGTGAVIYSGDVPADIATRRAASLDSSSPLAIALDGGEDYELLIALPEDRFPAAVEAAGEVPVSIIGTILSADHGVLLEEAGGARTALKPRGWEHFRRD